MAVTSGATVRYSRRGGTGTLKLTDVVDAASARELYEAAVQALSDGEAASLQVDLSKALRLDLSAIQILMALRRSLTDVGRGFAVKYGTTGVEESLSRLGVTL